MKKIIVFLVLIVLVSCKSKKVSPTPVIEEVKTVQLALTAVDANQKGKAYDLGKRILMTLEKLSKTCAKHRQWYGTFIDLKLVEVYQNSAEQNTVYRFKAMYTKKVANKELRVFMNDENQLTAIKTLDWNNAFTY